MTRAGRSTVVLGILTATVGVLPAVVPAQAAVRAAAYSSCADLRVDFPTGVANNTGSRTAGVRAGMIAPQVDATTYLDNAALDADNDGVACPVWRHTLVGKDVERAIRRGLAAQLGGGPYRVSCPAQPIARKGHVFRCRVKDLSTSASGIVTVTQTSNDGTFDWAVTSAAPTQQA
jgi:hypothetical protein